MGKFLRFALSGVLLGALSSPALAGTLLDPSTLFIGSGQGTACATGGCPLYNGELNNFGPTTLDIYQNQNGAKGLENPILLILGVPNNTFAPTTPTADLYTPATSGSPSTTVVGVTRGTTAFGLSIPTSGANAGYAGYFTGPGNTDVYDFIGISQNTNSSNSYTNWAMVDNVDLHVNFTGFGVYVFELNLNPQYSFTGQDLLNITGLSVPEGTFAVAYGQDSTHFYDTPFTEAGLMDVPFPPGGQTGVPEPSTVALLGTGILALGFSLRRRNRRPTSQTAA